MECLVQKATVGHQFSWKVSRREVGKQEQLQNVASALKTQLVLWCHRPKYNADLLPRGLTNLNSVRVLTLKRGHIKVCWQLSQIFHEVTTKILPQELTECLEYTRKSPLMLPLTRKPVEHLETQACWLVTNQKLVSCDLIRNSYQLPLFAPFQWFHGFSMVQWCRHFWHSKVSHEEIFSVASKRMATSSAMKLSVTRLGGIRGCWTQKVCVGHMIPTVRHVLSLVSLLCDLCELNFRSLGLR